MDIMLRVLHLCLYTILFNLIKHVKNHVVYMEIPRVNVTVYQVDYHLKDTRIKEICNKRDSICKSNMTNVCAVRILNDTKDYKDFDNLCYLFLHNMCDYPGQEYYTLWDDKCSSFFSSRRNTETITFNNYRKSGLQIAANTTRTVTATKLVARSGTSTSGFSPLYEIDDAYDLHPCPGSCTNVYSPICICVNRGSGKYLKYMTFLNHCLGDMYYCKNWREFQPPNDDDSESVSQSQLGWSYCAATRYLQFKSMADGASSMGHYGWLAGNYKFTHIMKPHEILPANG